MNLDFSDEQKEMRGQLAKLLQARAPRRAVREALEGRAAFDRALWEELGTLGWLSVAIPEEYGGQGMEHAMLCCVAEEMGLAMAAAPLASSIYLAAEAILLYGSEAQKQALLPKLGQGKEIGALAIAERQGPLSAASITARYENGRLSGAKIAVSDGMIATKLIVVALHEGEPCLCVADAAAAGVTRSAKTGVDPAHPPAEILFENVVAERLDCSGWQAIETLLTRAAVPLAFEQIGTAGAALAMATAYAKERKAFGRTIGSFQAIKHKLADIWIANELARANAYYAAWALDSDAEALKLAAATARVSASEALERAGRELIQIHGGIAVTWEHDAHLFYRRGQHLALMLGGLREWQGRVTQQLAAA